jgi:hypothetical protein
LLKLLKKLLEMLMLDFVLQLPQRLKCMIAIWVGVMPMLLAGVELKLPAMLLAELKVARVLVRVMIP